MATRPSGRETNQPGAVPFGFGSGSADGIRQACLRLSSGNGMSRRAHSSRSQRSSSGSTTGVSPQTRGDRLAGEVVGGRAQARRC